MQHLRRLLFIWALAAVSSPTAVAIDSRAYVERAVALIEAEEYSLARTYLEPALIDFRLTPGERSRAYYLRGFAFFAEGLHVSAHKDYNRALEFFPRNPVVLTAMAQLYLEGLGVEPNPQVAVALLREAAEADHAPAQLHLGIAYLRGLGLEQSVENARKWLTQAAEAGLPDAMINLAQSYRAPLAAEPAPAQAERWYRKALEAGRHEALMYLGFMAEEGEAGEPDPETARGHFAEAAEAGVPVAQAKLGHMYLTGQGGEADPARARALFQQAADQGHPAGFMGLAYLYETGTGVAQDDAQAMAWYQRAAEAGLLDAQIRMAYAALREDSLEGQQRAREWLAKAAAQNSPQALNDYAWLLATSEHASVRDGQQALTLALQAVDRVRTPAYLDTLAAAYAETGKFEQAVATQQEAIAMAPPDETELVQELKTHLAAFEAGKPWRE